MSKKLDLSGKKFGRWTVLNEAINKHSSGRVAWTCICDCGVQRDVRSDYLYNNRSLSCGCLKDENTSIRNTTHGMSKTKEYGIWQTMINRCTDPNVEGYPNYGGRGIKVCDRWLESFENFISDVGFRPSVKHSADRFPDINGNYEPNNFRWATRAEQQRGQRRNVWVEHNGEKMVLVDWVKKIGAPYSSVQVMLKNKKTPDQIVEYYKNKNKAA